MDPQPSKHPNIHHHNHHNQDSRNQNMVLSANMLNLIQRRERVVHHYYNDPAGNCTYGAGTLVHHGQCTEAELQTQVTDVQINQALTLRAQDAARAVRNAVTQQQLTQDQFDALVSFVYNVGAHNAHHVLQDVNRGHFQTAVHRMGQFIHVTPRDAHGRVQRDAHGRIISRVEPGLIIRRREESAPFQVNIRHRPHPVHPQQHNPR